MTERLLTNEDLTSQAWKKVRDYAEAELVLHRKNLESDASPEKTAKLRGQIRSLVLLLALGLPPTLAIEEEDEPE